MRRVAAVGDHAPEDLPYCIVTAPCQVGAGRTVHLAKVLITSTYVESGPLC